MNLTIDIKELVEWLVEKQYVNEYDADVLAADLIKCFCPKPELFYEELTPLVNRVMDPDANG